MELNDKLIEILDKVCERFGIFIDWTAQQVQENVVPYTMQLMERIIKYEITTSIVWIVISVIGITILGFLTWKLWKVLEELTLPLTLGIVGLTILICCQTFDIAKAVIFPELTVIEFVKNYVELNK